MSEWISRVCAKQKTFYVPPLSHSKSSQKSNKAINRTNSYKTYSSLCIIYPTPLSTLAGRKKNSKCAWNPAILFTRERIHLMDLLSKRFASHSIGMTCRHRFGHWKRIDKFFLVFLFHYLSCPLSILLRKSENL